MQNEGIVFSQGERVGDELVQLGLAQPHRRLHVTPGLLLAQNVGDVIGTEGACGVSLLYRGGNCLRAVIANQFEQLADLAS